LNQNGRYTFSGVSPGEYKLLALPPGESTRDLEAYEDAVEHVTVRPGDKLIKDLKLKAPEDR
jgi:hypothetical protein